jgi:sugar lactone lactonase YvrE
MKTTFDVALRATDRLGEGPWWDAELGELWRVDILAGLAHRWNPLTGAAIVVDVGQDVGFVVPTADGRLLAGRRTDAAVIDINGGEGNPEGEPVVPTPGSSPARFNDGKTDRSGRVWAGTIVDDQADPQAVFGKIDGAGFTTALTGLLISNGLGWSPDNRTMYVTDSGVQTIWAFDYDLEHGELTNQRVFATDEDCAPDGLTVDAEGGVWSAKWDGARVVRYDPDGTVSAVIEMPASRPTSCAFGGPNLDTLYVTSASVGLDDQEIEDTAAGSVFAAQTGVFGLRETPAVL